MNPIPVLPLIHHDVMSCALSCLAYQSFEPIGLTSFNLENVLPWLLQERCESARSLLMYRMLQWV